MTTIDDAAYKQWLKNVEHMKRTQLKATRSVILSTKPLKANLKRAAKKPHLYIIK